MTPVACQSLLQAPKTSLTHLPVFVCLTGTGDPGSCSRAAQYGLLHWICWAFVSSPEAATTAPEPSDISGPVCSPTSLSSRWPEQPGIHPADTLADSFGCWERRRTDGRLRHLLRPSVSLHRLLQQQPERRATTGWDSNGRQSLALRHGPAAVRRVARRFQGEQPEEQFQFRGNRRALTARTGL